MAADDPFKGIPLSEQAGTKKLDQRLFAPEPAVAPPAPKPSKPAKPKPLRTPTEPDSPPVKPTLAPKPASPATSKFDLDDPPFYKACFLFTQPELEALEDLKLELRRRLDTKVTKNDLIRSALHLLFEDCAANGERSYVRKKVRKR